MANPIDIEPVDKYGADGIPESIAMFTAGLEEVPEIASRNMHMGHAVPKVVFEQAATETESTIPTETS